MNQVLEWSRRFVADCDERGTPPLRVSGDAMLDVCRALLSSSSAEMREALEPFAKIALLRDMYPNAPDMIDAPDLVITADEVRKARAALSARAVEDEQATRSPEDGRATASTDRL